MMTGGGRSRGGECGGVCLPLAAPPTVAPGQSLAFWLLLRPPASDASVLLSDASSVLTTKAPTEAPRLIKPPAASGKKLVHHTSCTTGTLGTLVHWHTILSTLHTSSIAWTATQLPLHATARVQFSDDGAGPRQTLSLLMDLSMML